MGDAEDTFEISRGNIEWLLEDAPALFTRLAEGASKLVCRPEQRTAQLPAFEALVSDYNRVAREAGKPVVAPDECYAFATEVCAYFFMNRSR